MSQLKVEIFLFDQVGINQERLDHFTKFLSNDDKLYNENIALSTTNLDKIFNEKFKYIYIRSDYDIKIRIIGKGEIITDFVMLNYSTGQEIRLGYINPGLDETATIKFIGLKE